MAVPWPDRNPQGEAIHWWGLKNKTMGNPGDSSILVLSKTKEAGITPAQANMSIIFPAREKLKRLGIQSVLSILVPYS